MQTAVPAETRMLLENVRWETYVALADERTGNVPQMTYSQGMLELMSPRKEHEKIKSLLGAMIVAYCEEREIEIETVASTTFRRPDLERGFEADESYYIQLADLMRTRDEIDLSVDPPPELVVEIEITKSAIAKLEVFAMMGVPEVWRHDGASLRMFRLNNREYSAISESVALPRFPASLAESLLAERFNQGVMALIRQFRKSLA
jgi:Uma2 family endonuclease